ncbi:MAG: hypothetical protein H7A35_15250 [Planctomycetales bacterium]|nr:hypothetical protein [bacterium]UNM08187.1 MAG: hypothetical protein H7A35_15250 [Planctomycetales bacterium]
MAKVDPANLTHPQLIFGFLQAGPPLRRSRVMLVEASDPAPLLLIDAALGGRMGWGGWGAHSVSAELLKPKLPEVYTPEFWSKEIVSQEQLDGRPRVRRYRD